MQLFDEIPFLVGENVILRELRKGDEQGLNELVSEEEVYRFLPTFLFEQKYADKSLVISRHFEECVKTKETILSGVCLKNMPEEIVGIAEIYNYEEIKEKASIGYRLKKSVWGKGLATEVTKLLKNYLLSLGIGKITAHVMTENGASKRVLEKNGFICKWPNLTEDWGRGKPVLVDKFIFKIEKSDNRYIGRLN